MRCHNCGAPYDRSDTQCKYCRISLYAPNIIPLPPLPNEKLIGPLLEETAFIDDRSIKYDGRDEFTNNFMKNVYSHMYRPSEKELEELAKPRGFWDWLLVSKDKRMERALKEWKSSPGSHLSSSLQR